MCEMYFISITVTNIIQIQQENYSAQKCTYAQKLSDIFLPQYGKNQKDFEYFIPIK